MTEEEFLSKIENGYTSIQLFWMLVATRTKCLYCKTDFPEGITNKHPGVSRFHIDSRFWFTPEFLVHLHGTHGYCPETMTSFIETIGEDETRTPVPDL